MPDLPAWRITWTSVWSEIKGLPAESRGEGVLRMLVTLLMARVSEKEDSQALLEAQKLLCRLLLCHGTNQLPGAHPPMPQCKCCCGHNVVLIEMLNGLSWCFAGDGKGVLSGLFDSGEGGPFTSSPMLLFLALTSSQLQNVTITVNGNALTVKPKPEFKCVLLTLSQLFSIAYMVRSPSILRPAAHAACIARSG